MRLGKIMVFMAVLCVLLPFLIPLGAVTAIWFYATSLLVKLGRWAQEDDLDKVVNAMREDADG
jgi:hypothetical protein